MGTSPCTSRAGASRTATPLLEYLYAHVTRSEFTSRFQWRDGSIAFWDNRATWHSAQNDYQGERRLMHRITRRRLRIAGGDGGSGLGGYCFRRIVIAATPVARL
jgi:hypothetical protein